MTKKIIIVEVDEDKIFENDMLGEVEVTLNDAVLREAGWMADSGIIAIEVRDYEEDYLASHFFKKSHVV